MDAPKPRRRWFRFSLRTLFVLVTLLCVWLGWQVKIVNERKAFLKHVYFAGPANYITNPQPHRDLPFYRLWLGDKKIERIDAWNEADATAAAKLFPELRELYFVDTDNLIKNYDGDRTVSAQGARPQQD